MNNLSWILYGINVVENSGAILKVGWIALVVCAALCLVFFCGMMEATAHESEERKEGLTFFSKAAKWGVTALLLLSLCTLVIPSRDTMYMIVASEVGEEVVTSEEGVAIREILKLKLDDYLEELTK